MFFFQIFAVNGASFVSNITDWENQELNGSKTCWLDCRSGDSCLLGFMKIFKSNCT